MADEHVHKGISLAEDGPKEIKAKLDTFMAKCKGEGYCKDACSAQWKMKLQYQHYKDVMKSEYAKYKESVEAANAAIRKCPGKVVTKTVTK